MARRLVALATVASAIVGACVASLQLGTSEQAAVVVGPNPVDFGSVQVGTMSGAITLTVSPAGSGASSDTITAIIANCSGFSVDATGGSGARVFRNCGSDTMPSGQETFTEQQGLACPGEIVQTFTFKATFAPVVTGDVQCNGSVQVGSGSAASFVLVGKGTPPDKAMAIDPPEKVIDFGDVRKSSTSVTRVVEINNIGAMPLSVSSVSLADATSFDLQIPGIASTTFTISPGDKQVVTISCTPVDFLKYQTDLDIKSDAGTQTVALTCNGINSPLDISPSQFVLPPIRVFETRRATVRITNSSTAATLESVALVDPNPAIVVTAPSNLLMQNGQTADITIDYTPVIDQSGDVARLRVRFAGNDQLITVSADARLAKVASDPNTVEFGAVCPGQPATQDVEVFSEGRGSFVVKGASAGAPFGVSPASVMTTILPLRENQQTFAVTIEPGDQTGLVEADVTITTDAPDQMMFPIHASATVLPGDVSALPAEIDLGRVRVDRITSAATVTFTNCSADTVMITGEQLSSDEFLLTTAFAGPIPVAPAQSVPILVQLLPSSTGTKRGQLTITYTGGEQTVDLLGEGSQDRETYYACSAGDPASAGLVMCGITVVLRRRRRSVRS